MGLGVLFRLYLFLLGCFIVSEGGVAKRVPLFGCFMGGLDAAV